MSNALAEIRKRKQAIATQIAELQRQLEAFAIVEQTFGEQDKTQSPEQAQPPIASESFAGIVRNIVRRLQGEFTLDAVMQDSEAHGLNRTAVSYNLARFAKVGEISIVQQGAGRRPATYMRKEATEAHPS